MILEEWDYKEKNYSCSKKTCLFNSKIIKPQGFKIPLVAYNIRYRTLHICVRHNSISYILVLF